ncbi:hypothetical protein [Saccharopolyspora sp. NPDC002686]|uniref:hypothetical protein n=1 Tax=Saccharopolyspora sp. NPDC002686 TaxID=3154541 RepID=UPI00331B2249
MSDSPSEAVLAARRKFEEISSTTAAKLSESAQRSIESSEKANESTKNFTEKVQKVEGRVRDLIAQRARDSQRDNEIQLAAEDDEEPQDEVAAEYADLIASYPVAKPAEVTPASAEPGSAAPNSVEPRPVGRGPGVQGGVEQPSVDPRWQVQAGRFGRRDQQVTAPPPAAPPKPPSAPKPAPRRQPAFDDDDDFENQSWLR